MPKRSKTNCPARPLVYSQLENRQLLAGTVTFGSATFAASEPVGINLLDLNGFASGATVTIESSSGDSETLLITASQSVYFSTFIDSVEGSANQNDGILQITSGDTLTATYFDSDDGNGGTFTSTDTATIFVDDHRDDFESATALDLPFNLPGSIETFGDQDWFSFSAIGGFRYEFEVAFDDLSGSELNLFDTDGVTRLASTDSASSISWIAPESGTYFLSFDALNARDSGIYQLLGSSTVPSSSVEFSELAYFTPGAVTVFVADATGFAPGSTLLLESSSGDTETILIAPGVDFSSSINSTQGTTTPNDGILQLTSGDILTATYFDSDDGLGSTLTATALASIFVDDHGSDALTATPLSLPASVLGSIEIDGDQDWFRFDAVAGETFRFVVPNHRQLTVLTLYDTDGTTVLEQDEFTRPGIGWSAPSDGTYFISVGSFNSQNTGNYELTVDLVIDDHGSDAATATLLNLPASISGEIESPGDQDWFRFNAIAGESYRFEVPTHDESPDLILYDTDGITQLERDTSTGASIVWDAPSDGVYFLSVEKISSNEFGNYELTAELVPDDHGDDAATATSLNLPASISGEIELPGNQDWFRFNAIAGETYRFEIPTHDEPADLILYDTDGITQLERDNSTNPLIVWTAPSDGVYFLSVGNIFSNRTGNYELTAGLLVDDHGGDAATATLLNLPASIPSQIEIPGDQDWFHFNAVAGESYRFEVPTHDELPDLILYDTDGITQLDRDTSTGASILWTALIDGVYFLSVGNIFSSRTGNYELSAELILDDHSDDAATATLLDLPSSISGSIEVAGDQDWFSFNAAVGENFRFESPESDERTRITLYDTDGTTVLARDTASPPSIDWNAPSDGTYFLSVENLFNNDIGNYVVTATQIPDDHGDNAATGTLLDLTSSNSFSGSIETLGDQDWFRFNAVAGTAYRFAIPTSRNFIELTLYDTNGTTQLAQDGNEPAIFWVAPSDGIFFLSVEDGDDFNDDIGDYELSATTHNDDDHGGNFATATLLDIPANVVGTIETIGDQDWFQFNAIAGERYRFSIPTSDDSFIELTLFDIDGITELRQDDDTDPNIVWVAPSSGTYFLSVESVFDRLSNYELSVILNTDDHGNDAATATLIDDLPANIAGSIEVAGDQDFFRFTATADTRFEFSIPVHDESMELILYDTDGITELERDIFDDPTIIWVAPSDGTYFLFVENRFSTFIGNYELSVATIEDDHGQSAAFATALTLPANVSGSIEVAGDQDWFSFTATFGTKYEFSVPVHDEFMELILYDTDGTTQLERDIFDAPTILWSAPSDGTYFLSAGRFFNGIGTYELTALVFEDDHSDIPVAATPFSVNSVISGSTETEMDLDVFRFDAIAGLVYDFRLDWTEIGAGNATGELSLLDTDGTTVLVNDSFLPEFSWDALESGTYFLVVEGTFLDDLGDYQLFLSSSALQETAIAFDSDAYLTPNQVTVDLLDATGFAPGSTVTVESSSGDSEELTITSTGVLFSATLDTAEGVAIPNDGTLQIASGDRLVATYFDSDQSLGGRFVLDAASIFVDDHGDSADTATFVDFPSTTSGVIELNSDKDWFRFPAVAGLEYVFETTFDSSVPSTLTLYDTDGTSQLVTNVTNVSLNGSQISWQAPETGEFFLVVESDSPASYELSSAITATLFVEDVIVSGTQFASEYIDAVSDGNGLGYSLFGDRQLESLPWTNIDTFYLQFSEDVSASLTVDDVILTGTNGGTYDLELAGYDSVSNTAEFRINGSVTNDSLAISIFDGSVTNSLGLMLDGELATRQSDPSGDGTQGGQFDFFFNVLVGDADGSGQINSIDTFGVFASNTFATDQTNFRRDIDGSGQINSTDAFIAHANSNNGLPASPTLPVAPSFSTSTVSTDGHGNDFNLVEAITNPTGDVGSIEQVGALNAINVSAANSDATEPTNSSPVTAVTTPIGNDDSSDQVNSVDLLNAVVSDSDATTSINSSASLVLPTLPAPQTSSVTPLSNSDRDDFFSEGTTSLALVAPMELQEFEIAPIPAVFTAFTLNQTNLENEAKAKGKGKGKGKGKELLQTNRLREIQGLGSAIALPTQELNIDSEIHETYPIDLVDLSEEDKKRRQLLETEEDIAMVESL